MYNTETKWKISLVTYGFNKDREGIEHLKWICDLCWLAICIYLYSTVHNLEISLILVNLQWRRKSL